MTTPTPLPCPFCGAVAMVIDRGHSIVVECLGCNVFGPMSKGYDDAVAAWNKAPRPAQPGALQAAAIEAVGLLTGASHHRMRGYNLCSACEERWPCDVEEARRLISAVLGDQ